MNGTAVDLTSSPTSVENTSTNDPSIPLHILASGLDENPTDIPTFLTSLFPPSASLSDLDATLNELLTRLTLLSQDTSSALEQSISDITRTVPRLNYDLQFMRESATTLQTSLDSVQGRVRRVEESKRQTEGSEVSSASTKSLEKLTHLDKLKTRMESARDILREAESWSTLESEITSSISSLEWEKAGSRLAEAEKSMVVFQSTPAEYESRKSLLVSLQNGLEAALSTALGLALESGDTEACARFYGVFENMGREIEFRNYYFTQRRRGVLDEWSVFEGGDGFAGFLPGWYTLLGQTIEKEVEQVGRIYPQGSGQRVLADFIQSILGSLSPSLESRLGSMADAQGSTALPELIIAYKATEEIVEGLHSILEKVSNEVSPAPTSPITPTRSTPRKTPSRSVSDIPHRMTQLNLSPEKSTAVLGIDNQWESTLFESFLDLQSAYSTLERRYLLHLLRSIPSSSTKQDATALSERSISIFHMASEAIARCTAFTHGYGTPGLLLALGDFLATFLEGSHSVLDTRPIIIQDELDFGLDYSTEDWAAFQSGLQVLKICREISNRLSSFEQKLSSSLTHILDAPHQSSASGGISLLRQSTLNSAELHTLLSSPPTILLAPAHKALSDLTSAAQVSLSSIILSPLRTALSSYPSLPIWSQQPKTARRDGLSIPTFSLSPTDTIARVSEGLLNLLRVFEVYAQDPALGYSLQTLPFIPATSLPPISTTLPPPELVLSTWISSLALTLLAHLTRNTLPGIQKLSAPGANQLAADLGYLENAVRALDVEWADLEVWREGSEVDENSWRERAEKRENGVDEGEIWSRIGRLRGWTT